MITVFFNETGFAITGENINSSLRCYPATDSNGERVFSDIHHTYKVLWLALNEIKNKKISGDVTVYGNTRIIDEMSCVIDPFDEACKQWRNYIKRNVLSSIRSVVFFRKKSHEYVQDNVTRGQSSIKQITSNEVRGILDILTRNQDNRIFNKKKRIITRFKGL